jgi:hypothetical protein
VAGVDDRFGAAEAGVRCERAERIRVNPDGRQLAFVSGRRHAEIWVLENFLPAAARQSAKK